MSDHISVLDKQLCLVLNKSWVAIGALTIRKAFVALAGGLDGEHPVMALDIGFGEDGLEYATPTTMEDWFKLPVRENDLYVLVKNGKVRAPTVIVSANFNKIPVKTPRLTNGNIFERDSHTCAYTGRRLTRKQLSVDHIIPASRGGRNIWTNLVTADKAINTYKADRTPEEAGLRLLKKPIAPPSVPVTFHLKDAVVKDWEPFLMNN